DHSLNPATYHPQQRQLDKNVYGMHPSRPAPVHVLVDEAADERAEDGSEERRVGSVKALIDVSRVQLGKEGKEVDRY
ncbi:hypothetical protein FIBSPDRAFT_866922, partial [Athelia psychrophila]